MVNATGGFGTSLLYAASKGRRDTVMALCKWGSDVNRKGAHGVTCLHLACSRGDIDLVRFLVSEANNADVNAIEDFTRNTPLHAACQNGHLSVVKCLLNVKEINVNVKNVDHFTPLHCAALNWHWTVIQFLMTEGGANVNAVTMDGKTPTELILEKDYSQQIMQLQVPTIHHLLEETKNITEQGRARFELLLLLHAARNGDFEDVKKLMKCNETFQFDNNNSPLHYASSAGHLDIVEYLSEAGKFNVDGAFGRRTPLHLACANGHLSVVQHLTETAKADVNATDGDDNTPLHLACSYDHQLVVQHLTESANGANVNAKNRYCLAPLHLACSNGHLTIVECLVKRAGVDVNVKDRWDQTPLQNGHLQVVKCLTKGPEAEVNAKDKEGNTPLHLACSNGHWEIFQNLVEEGRADVTAKNMDNKTPLQLYNEWSQSKSVKAS